MQKVYNVFRLKLYVHLVRTEFVGSFNM